MRIRRDSQKRCGQDGDIRAATHGPHSRVASGGLSSALSDQKDEPRICHKCFAMITTEWAWVWQGEYICPDCLVDMICEG